MSVVLFVPHCNSIGKLQYNTSEQSTSNSEILDNTFHFFAKSNSSEPFCSNKTFSVIVLHAQVLISKNLNYTEEKDLGGRKLGNSNVKLFDQPFSIGLEQFSNVLPAPENVRFCNVDAKIVWLTHEIKAL